LLNIQKRDSIDRVHWEKFSSKYSELIFWKFIPQSRQHKPIKYKEMRTAKHNIKRIFRLNKSIHFQIMIVRKYYLKKSVSYHRILNTKIWLNRVVVDFYFKDLTYLWFTFNIIVLAIEIKLFQYKAKHLSA
jgi:hypothetical protein